MLDGYNLQRHAMQTLAIAVCSLGLLFSGPTWAAETHSEPAQKAATGKSAPGNASGSHAESTGGTPHWGYTGDAGN